MPKLIKAVVTRPYIFRVTFSDGHTEEITVEAESVISAGLKMPADAVTWEPIGENLI